MLAVALMVPAAALMAAGCGGGDKQDKPKPQAPAVKPGAEGKGGAPTASTGDKTALEATGTGTLKGKVTYVGNPPARADLKIPEENKDKSHCLKGDIKDPTWMVGADKSVQNVVVWLRPPDGKYFKIPADQQQRTDVVKMDQPFCAFEPHVVVLYTYYWDPDSKALKQTGQRFEVRNSAPISHNTNITPNNKLVNTGKNELIPAGKHMDYDAKPGSNSQPGGEELLNIACNIHQWMNARALVFDHPYFAVTNDKGEYEIKNVPAGADLVVAYWHETFGDRPKQSAKTDKVTVKSGETATKDFTVGGK
jgi:hypothetical protein